MYPLPNCDMFLVQRFAMYLLSLHAVQTFVLAAPGGVSNVS